MIWSGFGLLCAASFRVPENELSDGPFCNKSRNTGTAELTQVGKCGYKHLRSGSSGSCHSPCAKPQASLR
jgi:hypothetical protein